MFAVQLFSCVCYNQCWLWQRWDVSHSVMELVGESPPQTPPPPLMAGVRWGHTWYWATSIIITGWHQTPSLMMVTTSPGQATHTSAQLRLAGDLISHRRPHCRSQYRHVWGEEGGGEGWSDTAGRKHHFFLAQLQSAAKQPGGLRYKVQSWGRGGRKLFLWLIFCHLHLCPVYQRVTVYQCLRAQCHSVISRYGRADPG